MYTYFSLFRYIQSSPVLLSIVTFILCYKTALFADLGCGERGRGKKDERDAPRLPKGVFARALVDGRHRAPERPRVSPHRRFPQPQKDGMKKPGGLITLGEPGMPTTPL
jgi:hypothetical protein